MSTQKKQALRREKKVQCCPLFNISRQLNKVGWKKGSVQHSFDISDLSSSSFIAGSRSSYISASSNSILDEYMETAESCDFTVLLGDAPEILSNSLFWQQEGSASNS